ncbi:surface polysaccharide O-acyltransferase-like enzyme [Metabacillus malikii]|uniref:Surface polysaccharide O-acyltransferase-like enzyme n=2 Tax=Metabacillus malikii TaxID=1504265 RepID=A0ABT9ZM25_9BACI|nr:surface polysaccharide O-acyltransferase-like enzyme [Metabacillus malikii]
MNKSNRILKYTSEASMPFYILHQPIIILLGFFIYTLDWVVPLKLFLLVITAFAAIMCLYHYAIRQVNFLRILFGLKQIRKETLEQEKVVISK